MKIRELAALGSLTLLMACSASPMLSPSRGVFESETMYRAIESAIDDIDLGGLSGKYILITPSSLSGTAGGVGWIGGYAPLRDATVNFGQSTVSATGTHTNSGSGTASFTGPLGMPALSQPSSLAGSKDDFDYAQSRLAEKLALANVKVAASPAECDDKECIKAFVRINVSGEPHRQDFVLMSKDTFIARAKVEITAIDKCGKVVLSARHGKTATSTREYVLYMSADGDMSDVSVNNYAFPPEGRAIAAASAAGCG